MKVVNVKNIALSTCIGLFSFHTYVMDKATYSQEFSLMDPGSRNIASPAQLIRPESHTSKPVAVIKHGSSDDGFDIQTEKKELQSTTTTKHGSSDDNFPQAIKSSKNNKVDDFKCKKTRNIYTFLNDSYKASKQCEFYYKKEKINKNTTSIRFVFKKDGEVFYRPAKNKKAVLIKGDGTKESFNRAAKKYYEKQLSEAKVFFIEKTEKREKKALADKILKKSKTTTTSAAIDGKNSEIPVLTPREEIIVEDKTNKKEEEPKKEVANIKKTEEKPAKEEVTVKAKPVSEATEVLVEDKEIDVKEIKTIFKDLDKLIKKQNACDYDQDSMDEIESIKDAVTEAINQDGDIKAFSRVERSQIKSLNTEQANHILDQALDIEELLETTSDASFDDKITCLSDKAILGDKDAQFKYYAENIRPLIVSAIDGGTDELSELATSLNKNESFTKLNASNKFINNITEQESKIAGAALTCKETKPVETCVKELSAEAIKTQKAIITQKGLSTEEQITLGSAFYSLNHWIEKLGGKAVQFFESRTTPKVATNDKTQKTTAEKILDASKEQQKILNRVRGLGRIYKTAHQAHKASNARKGKVKVFAKERQKSFIVDPEGTPVTEKEIGFTSGAIL